MCAFWGLYISLFSLTDRSPYIHCVAPLLLSTAILLIDYIGLSSANKSITKTSAGFPPAHIDLLTPTYRDLYSGPFVKLKS